MEIQSLIDITSHHQGCRVFASARTPSKIAHLRDLGIETIILDVLSTESIKSAVDEVSKATDGSLDYLINNSGGGYSMPIADVDIAEAKKLYDLNVWSVISVTQAFLPLLIKAKGTIVNQTSVCAIANIPFSGIYNSSKAAASMITSNMRLEMEPLGIRVVELRTGAVKSNFFQNQGEGEKLVLPEKSYYAPAKVEVESAMNKFAATQMNAEVYARNVVDDVLHSKGSTSWRGQGATLVWVVFTFGWHTLFDFILGRGVGLEKVRAAHA